MDTNRLKRFATEARNILMQGVAHRFTPCPRTSIRNGVHFNVP